jgi:hypothetical protein
LLNHNIQSTRLISRSKQSPPINLFLSHRRVFVHCNAAFPASVQIDEPGRNSTAGDVRHSPPTKRSKMGTFRDTLKAADSWLAQRKTEVPCSRLTWSADEGLVAISFMFLCQGLNRKLIRTKSCEATGLSCRGTPGISSTLPDLQRQRTSLAMPISKMAIRSFVSSSRASVLALPLE